MNNSIAALTHDERKILAKTEELINPLPLSNHTTFSLILQASHQVITQGFTWLGVQDLIERILDRVFRCEGRHAGSYTVSAWHGLPEYRPLLLLATLSHPYKTPEKPTLIGRQADRQGRLSRSIERFHL